MNNLLSEHYLDSLRILIDRRTTTHVTACDWCGKSIEYTVTDLGNGYVRGAPPKCCGDECHRLDREQWEFAQKGHAEALTLFREANGYVGRF